jgi:hypothetical protein
MWNLLHKQIALSRILRVGTEIMCEGSGIILFIDLPTASVQLCSVRLLEDEQ